MTKLATLFSDLKGVSNCDCYFDLDECVFTLEYRESNIGLVFLAEHRQKYKMRMILKVLDELSKVDKFINIKNLNDVMNIEL